MYVTFFHICVNISVNPECAGNKLIQYNIVNIMIPDALAACVARTSAPMIFAFEIQVFVLHEEESICLYC